MYTVMIKRPMYSVSHLGISANTPFFKRDLHLRKETYKREPYKRYIRIETKETNLFSIISE